MARVFAMVFAPSPRVHLQVQASLPPRDWVLACEPTMISCLKILHSANGRGPFLRAQLLGRALPSEASAPWQLPTFDPVIWTRFPFDFWFVLRTVALLAGVCVLL